MRNETLLPAADSLAVLLDPEWRYEGKLPVALIALSDGKTRVCVYGSHRWTSYEHDHTTEAEAQAAYASLIQEPILTKAVLRRHGLRQS